MKKKNIGFIICAVIFFGCATNPQTTKTNLLKVQGDPDKWIFSESRLQILKHDDIKEIQMARTIYHLMKKRFNDHPVVVEFLNQRIFHLTSLIEETFKYYDLLIERFGDHKNVFQIYYFHDDSHFDTGFIILSDDGNILYIEGFTFEGNRIELDN